MKKVALLLFSGIIGSSVGFSTTGSFSASRTSSTPTSLFQSRQTASPSTFSKPNVGFGQAPMTQPQTAAAPYENAPLANMDREQKKKNYSRGTPIPRRRLRSGEEAAGLAEIVERQLERGVHCHSSMRDTCRDYNREFVTCYFM